MTGKIKKKESLNKTRAVMKENIGIRLKYVFKRNYYLVLRSIVFRDSCNVVI